MRSFGEQYECDWWQRTKETIPPFNNLLSIILYSDATTFDGLGKTSGHPIFLTLGNIPNSFRNLPEAKVLVGFLPKLQNCMNQTSSAFRSLQRESYHRCFKTLLFPLHKKPDALYFGVKGRAILFAPRISVFLADMLEANDVTATYKGARCKMPCHNCMIPLEKLNDMKLSSEEIIPRTKQKMQLAIKENRMKEVSVHNIENAFWLFK
jgi:hypothetical protein